MTETPDASDAQFVDGLKGLIGRRIRVWYMVESAEGGAQRETAEGRLASVQAEVVLTESRLIQPTMANDQATRTASLGSIRGYNELDPRDGTVTRTVVRPHRAGS